MNSTISSPVGWPVEYADSISVDEYVSSQRVSRI